MRQQLAGFARAWMAGRPGCPVTAEAERMEASKMKLGCLWHGCEPHDDVHLQNLGGYSFFCNPLQ